MTKQEIISELQDIRYYNTHREMFSKAENTGFKEIVLDKIGKYDNLIHNAPLRLKMIYHVLFTEGRTQTDTAKELGLSLSYTKCLIRKLYTYLLEQTNR